MVDSGILVQDSLPAIASRHLLDVLAGKDPSVPDRETWGTTPEAVEGLRAMESMFPPAMSFEELEQLEQERSS